MFDGVTGNESIARIPVSPGFRGLISVGHFDSASVSDVHGLSAASVSLVVDLREDAPQDACPGIPVTHLPIFTAHSRAATREEVFEWLLMTQAHQLTSAVSTIAVADGAVLLQGDPDEISTALVTALTLLAAGAVPAAVAEVFGPHEGSDMSPTAQSPDTFYYVLRVLDRFNGVENYLLRHGLSVGQFHALRDRYEERHDEP